MALDALNNYKTGISISLAGTNGTDWMLEPLYWDRLCEDRHVIYIRSATQISFTHNARNRMYKRRDGYTGWNTIGANGEDGIADSGDEGQIRYKVDGDSNHQNSYALATPAIPSTPIEAYSTPLTFSTLTYPASGNTSGGGAVLGRIGNNGGAITSKTARFCYGHQDAAGNECHTIAVCDDCRGITGVLADAEYYSDDGRVFMFVVDPVTPCIQVRSTGGKFYTTPCKTYFMPKIHEQTTYIEGAVEIELKALTGDTVYYRINAGSWQSGSNPILTQADFGTGSNTLEYYYEGNSAHVAERTIVKDPSHPSSGETHGYLMALSGANWAAMLNRITRAPYAGAWANVIGFQGARAAWDANRRLGRRYVPQTAALNAIAAKALGNDAVPATDGTARTYAAYAKEMLLENCRTIDSLGFERNHTGGDPIPCRELIYRGYWDVRPHLDMAYAYDILIDQYKSTQHADGITPVEDYYIRDCLAGMIVEALMYSCSMEGTRIQLNYGGMWDVSRKVGALVAAIAMPTYSTPHYGTCGLDGNTATYTYTPWHTTPLTWKKAFLDDDTTLLGFPNHANRFGIDVYNCLSDGRFNDKKSYMDAGLCGGIFLQALLVCKFHYPAKTFPYAELTYKRACMGDLYGTKLDGSTFGPGRYIYLPLLNSAFPEIADTVIDFVRGEPSSSQWSDDRLISGQEIRSIIGYDDEYVAGSGTPESAPTFTTQPASATRTAGESIAFTVVITGNPTPTRQWRKDGANISGQTGTSYTIASTVVGDAGIYDCVATNSVAPGGVTSAAATLVVNAIPPTPDPVTKRTNYKTPSVVIFAT